MVLTLKTQEDIPATEPTENMCACSRKAFIHSFIHSTNGLERLLFARLLLPPSKTKTKTRTKISLSRLRSSHRFETFASSIDTTVLTFKILSSQIQSHESINHRGSS